MHVINHPRTLLTRLKSKNVADRLMSVSVLFLLGAIVHKAWMDLDVAWDSIGYHLPFAGLRLGIISPDEYRLSRFMTERMHGFPILPDLIQGILWRVTSRIQAPNLIGLLGLLPLVVIIKRLFGVPLTYSLIALLSIPVVLIQSSSSYIDLFSNAWFAAMLMLIWSAVIQPADFSITRLLCLIACFAIVLNSKMQLEALALAALGAFLSLLWIGNQRFTRLRFFVKNARSWRKYGVIGALVTLFAVGLENPVKN